MAFDLSSLSSLFKSGVSGASEDTFLGVDIGASAIKIVQLKNVRRVPTLETYGELQLGPYENTDIGRGTNLPQHKLVEALIDILRESGATARQVGFAISYNSSFTNIITLPTLDQSQVATMLPVEARKYVPMSLSKVTLDWAVLEENAGKKETLVLLSAIFNEAVTRYESVVQGAQLKTMCSEIELFSSIRSVVSPSDTRVAVLDFGASSTRLYIVENGFIRKTHSALLSSVDINKALETAYKINFVTAEEIKRMYGLEGNASYPQMDKVVGQALERGLRELHTVTSRYEQERGTQIDKIIITGGGALLKGLPVRVQNTFSKPVVYADSFAKVAYPAFLEDTLKEAGPSFAVALGVALRAFQEAN